ncbi:hypothetical protein MAR_035299, partial [Mya arenaria]
MCTYEVPYIPHNVNPLSVAVNSSGKKRLILDLSVVNTFLKDERLRSRNSKSALFRERFGSETKYLVYTVLAFGVKSAPRTITKYLPPF